MLADLEFQSNQIPSHAASYTAGISGQSAAFSHQIWRDMQET
jgi:hypothetical protein